MDPKVISKTIQEFDGRRWYRCGRYFRSSSAKQKLLHIAVWTHAHGPPPARHHVHHRNEDRADNRLANLECLTQGEHLSRHMTPERRRAQAARIVKFAVPAARAWHRSKAGRAWHREHARRVWEGVVARGPRRLTCRSCGADFETFRGGEGVKYCSATCRAAGNRGARSVWKKRSVAKGQCGATTPEGPCKSWPVRGAVRCRWH